jgi:c(7)-type cytochrome triheme protein
MGSYDREGSPRADLRWLAAFLAAVSVAAGCGKAAAVFLDLPEKPAAPATQAATGQGGLSNILQEETGPPPPIEYVSDPDSVLALLPRDPAGYVDWMAALRLGVIRPRRKLPDEPLELALPFGYDFKIKGPTPLFDALFPHSSHTEWLDCRTCHPAIFPYRGTEISMEMINRGEACGRCHARVAFPAAACGRCHLDLGQTAGSGQAFLGEDMVLTRSEPGDTSRAPAGAFPPARFSHWVHRIRYRCSACHPDLFEARAGATVVKMQDLQQGKSCGRCHNGQVTFGTLQCNRCHSSVGEDG